MTWLKSYLEDDSISSALAGVMDKPGQIQKYFDTVTTFVLKTYKVRDPTVGCAEGRVQFLSYKTVTTL